MRNFISNLHRLAALFVLLLTESCGSFRNGTRCSEPKLKLRDPRVPAALLVAAELFRKPG